MLKRRPNRLARLALTTSVTAFGSAALVAGSAAPLHAQETQQTEPQDGFVTTLARVILGVGTERVAIDTPQAVTVVDSSDLAQSRPTMLSDMFKSVPGIQITGASARIAGQAFNIRGIGNADQPASQARIIVNVDGSPKFFEQYRMGSFFGDPELFKRVEVLRGPASSTLYGSGALGGVVNFTSKDASDFLAEGESNALRFKAGYDSNGERYRAGLTWATRPDDRFEMLGALNWGTGHTVQDGAGVDIVGTGFDRVSGLAKGTYRFGNDQDQSVTLSLSRTDSDLDDTAVAQTGGAAAGGFGTADVTTLDDTVSLTYRHEATANDLIDLTASLTWSDTAVTKNNFSYGFMCMPGTLSVLCDSDYAYETLTARVENTADLSSGAWENYLTFGIQVSEQERTALSSVGTLGFHPEGTETKSAVYVQGEFTWNEKLTLIPGLRAEYVEQTPGADAEAAGGSRQTDNAISPKLAAMYRINDNWGLFGSVARTERMPTLDELYSTEGESYSFTTGLYSAARTASLNLEKETAETVELGFTYQTEGIFSADDRLDLKVTGFHNDVKNLIATTARPTSTAPGLTPVAYFSNIASAEIWGAELEAAYDAERWFGQLAWSNVKSRDKDTRATLTDTPAENVVLTLGAKFPDHDLTVGWRAMYFDSITTASESTSGQAHDLHDLFVTWKPEEGALQGFEVNLGVENVFDTIYRNNLALDNGAGRNVGVSIAKTMTW